VAVTPPFAERAELRVRMRTSRIRITCFGLAAALALGCSGGPPLRVSHASADEARRLIRSNVAATGQLSDYTKIVLRNHELMREYGRDPDGAIASLREDVVDGKGGLVEYFALAELSLKRAEDLDRRAWRRARAREKRLNRGMVRKAPYYTSDETPLIEAAKRHYRAALLYAYTFLFTEDEVPTLTMIDPRYRIAADVYSRAIIEAFRDRAGYQVFTAGRFDLPFGELIVDFDEMELRWENRLLIDFLPADEFEIRGLRNRYRRPGIGAPLAARTRPIDPNDPAGYLVARKAVVAANVVLLFEDPRAAIATGEATGELIITPAAEAGQIDVNGHPLPLETQPSVALAASLEESDVWEGRLSAFFGRLTRLNDDNRLFSWEPRREGQIPVVFIHGTMSTPVVWADMVNDLQSDPTIRDRYQFLFFAYESGAPILYSSMLLRRSLDRAVQSLDGAGSDACLHDMVLIGHSQGGLLAKAVSIDAGKTIWDAFFDEPLEETRFRPATKALLREAVFVEPDPNVGRVVFISTPHRGSYVASSDLLRRLSSWAIRFPSDLAQITADAAGISSDPRSVYSGFRLSTAIDNMSPKDDFIQVLSSIPVAPSVPAHSIISVKPGQEIETGDDGVVKYRSAHIEEAQSELVVRSSHSSQRHPKTIEEVRRILLLHAQQAECAGNQ
jgi:pimeloyl-ACP methyl ester carboxylesterase